jgi:hypothetical protein
MRKAITRLGKDLEPPRNNSLILPLLNHLLMAPKNWDMFNHKPVCIVLWKGVSFSCILILTSPFAWFEVNLHTISAVITDFDGRL